MMRKQVAFALLLLSSSSFAAVPLPAGGRHGMVASASEIASRVGVDILEKGGNAVDAAVAVALALAVTWPSAGNLGGGGFLLLRRADGTAEVIDYRERAPLAATRDMYLDAKGNVIPNASTVGYRAVGVPGTVAGLALAHKRHGKLPWATLVEPAIALAAGGFPLDTATVQTLREATPLLAQFPDSKRIFLAGLVGGKGPQVGDRLVQPELAGTLARIAKDPRDFYDGETARRIVDDMKAHGGIVTMADLREYEPTLRQPLRGTYRGLEVLTMPPPSSGGAVLLEMLNMLEAHDLAKMTPGSSQEIHLYVEVMRRAFADRAQFLGDTDFVKGVPVAGMIAKKYAAARGADIDLAHATPSEKVGAGQPTGYESHETTHFVVVDADGNAVTSTYTLNASFGSGATAAGTGVLLNDEMDDFTSKVGAPNMFGLLQSEANAIAPRKRPLSAMTPTLLVDKGQLRAALGSPGGPTIINTVLQVIVNLVDHHMNLREAVDFPRIHHQWMPDLILWEPFGLSSDTRAALEKMGHKLAPKPRYMGDAEGVWIDPQDTTRYGASDRRLGGRAVGY